MKITRVGDELYRSFPDEMSYEQRTDLMIRILLKEGLSVYEIQAVMWGILEQTDIIMRCLKFKGVMCE